MLFPWWRGYFEQINDWCVSVCVWDRLAIIRWVPLKHPGSSLKKSGPGWDGSRQMLAFPPSTLNLQAAVSSADGRFHGEMLPVHLLQPFKWPRPLQRKVRTFKSSFFFGPDLPLLEQLGTPSHMYLFEQSLQEWPEATLRQVQMSLLITAMEKELAWEKEDRGYTAIFFYTIFLNLLLLQ